MKKVLLINACARPNSRTLALAQAAANQMDSEYETLNLYQEKLQPLDYAALSERERCAARGDFEHSMFRFARRFKEADEIVIAAPYWDLSFPSILKCFIEAVCVSGLTFHYGEDGSVISHCRCQRLVYVTTAGGYIGAHHHGYDYLKAVSSSLFGIENTVCIAAEGLDIIGNDVDAILESARQEIKQRLI